MPCAMSHPPDRKTLVLQPAASGRRLFDVCLAGVQKVDHRLAVAQVLRAVGQCHPVARALKFYGQNFANGGRRAVGQHHDFV